jgi:homoserine kinase
MCPLLAPLRSLCGERGVLGAALSGSGPSVLVILDPQVSAEATRRKIAAFLRERNLHAELILTSMEARGARERRKWNTGATASTPPVPEFD